MSNPNSSKPRLRETLEGALGDVLGNLISTIIMIVIGAAGITSGVATVGWIPTLIVAFGFIGLMFAWYRLDPGFQRFLNRRISLLKHILTKDTDNIPEWNLITDDVLRMISKEANCERKHLDINFRRITKKGSQELLEIVIQDTISSSTWHLLIDKSGNVINQYGGWPASFIECPNCSTPVLFPLTVNYPAPNSKDISSFLRREYSLLSDTEACRNCKRSVTVEYHKIFKRASGDISIVHPTRIISQKAKTGFQAKVMFTINNKGQATVVCVDINFKVKVMKSDGTFEEKNMNVRNRKANINPFGNTNIQWVVGLPSNPVTVLAPDPQLSISHYSC